MNAFQSHKKKVYPICTIRSTPDKPVHCIVWAKELLKLAFGIQQDSMLHDDGEDTRQHSVFGTSVSKLRIEVSFNTLNAAFIALFHTEIIRQIALQEHSPTGDVANIVERKPIETSVIESALRRSCSVTNETREKMPDDRAVWSVDESIYQLAEVCRRLRERCSKKEIIEFDKDDNDVMVFVAAAANLRAANYVKIPLQSLYDAKGIAGNIIPAIATTNAIVAALQTSQLVKLLGLKRSGLYPSQVRKSCAYVACNRLVVGRGLFLLNSTSLDEPQPNCFVCRASQIDISLDMNKMSLKTFVDNVLIKHLNFLKPAVDAGDSGLYDPDDERLQCFLALNLAEISSLSDGVMLAATDFATDLELSIVLHHKSDLDPEKYPLGFAMFEDINKCDTAEQDKSSKKRAFPKDDAFQESEEPLTKKAK
mmetsp:Transcript_5833/g.8606  ORF Transcript_5833/g.8606 Transcript_5833/m.8606 type:complete len:423 (-) Transcript_5833:1837-3105(-)